MAVLTVKAMKDFINSQIKEVDAIESFDEDTTVDDVINFLECHDYEAPYITYNNDAFHIVDCSVFSEYSLIEPLDFSHCKSSTECVVLEANEILKAVYFELIRDMISEYLEYA